MITLDTGNHDTLSDTIDSIFRRCGDDPSCIAAAIRGLDPDIRHEILSSDLLNAWQVFWYHFATNPGAEAEEFLNFHSAGELAEGVPMGEAGILTLTFSVTDDEPAISISDDIREVARFTGSSAWTDTLRFFDDN